MNHCQDSCRGNIACAAVKEQELESEAERFSRAVEAENFGEDAFPAEDESDVEQSELQQQYTALQDQVEHCIYRFQLQL